MRSWRYVIELLDLNEAVERIVSGIDPLRTRELVHLRDADGRVTATDIFAQVDLPPFPSSAMDGIAVATKLLVGPPPYELSIVGESRAGHPFDSKTPIPAHHCVRVFTGATLPADCDAVIIQEDCEFRPGDTPLHAIAQVQPHPGDNVRAMGHDISTTERIVTAGERLNPFSVGWLGACGETKVCVLKRPKVCIFSTGDELRDPGSPLGPGLIYDANRILLSLMLARLPVEVEDLGILPDDPEAIRTALTAAAHGSDMLITSAGVSVGDADYVASTLRHIGTLEIWKLLIKPGKPLAYGRIDDCLFFGLPGNPVSTVVTFLTTVRPALFRLCGAPPDAQSEYLATLANEVHHKPGREEFQRGQITGPAQDRTVRVTGDQSSNRLASFRGANCLIRIPKTAGDLTPGTQVNVLPFNGWLM